MRRRKTSTQRAQGERGDHHGQHGLPGDLVGAQRRAGQLAGPVDPDQHRAAGPGAGRGDHIAVAGRAVRRGPAGAGFGQGHPAVADVHRVRRVRQQDRRDLTPAGVLGPGHLEGRRPRPSSGRQRDERCTDQERGHGRRHNGRRYPVRGAPERVAVRPQPAQPQRAPQAGPHDLSSASRLPLLLSSSGRRGT